LWVSQVPLFAQSSGLKPVSFPVIQWDKFVPWNDMFWIVKGCRMRYLWVS
jgi:hypothetical protein